MHDLLMQVPNIDSRKMQPLPWRIDLTAYGKCITIRSRTDRDIMSFWGGDSRDPKNAEWCTAAQMEAHAKYTEHVVNHFPDLQALITMLYERGQMNQITRELIEKTMEKCYYAEVPPYVGKR